MRRLFLFIAFVIFASTWSRPACAQFGGIGGFGGLGGYKDPNAEIDQARSQIKSRMGTYARPQTSHARTTRPSLSNPASKDSYGRMDLAGHAVPGYPAIRGDLTGNNAARVSRGGANGRGGRHYVRPRR